MLQGAQGALRQCVGTVLRHNALGARPQPAPLRHLAHAAGGSGQVEPPDLRELARMAQLGITDKQVEEWGPQVAGIVDWFGQLQAVDVEGVPPALRAEVDSENFLRADAPEAFEAQEELLRQVPAREGAFVRVPKIATAADD